MRKVEDKVISSLVTHDVDLAIWDLGIILSNSEWCCLVDILDMLLSLEV